MCPGGGFIVSGALLKRSVWGLPWPNSVVTIYDQQGASVVV